MVYTPVGGGGGGGTDLFQLSPSQLTSAQSNFNKASQDTYNYMSDLVNVMQTAAAGAIAITELAKLASALENLQARLEVSMNCLLLAQYNAGLGLQNSGDDTSSLDQWLRNMFQKMGLYPGWEVPPWDKPLPQPQEPTPPWVIPPIKPQPQPIPPILPPIPLPGGIQIPGLGIPPLNFNSYSTNPWSGTQGYGLTSPLISNTYSSALTQPGNFGTTGNIWNIYPSILP
jgi:hypothetical protein